METYHGHVRTPADAIVLFEACRLGLLPRVQRRLSEKERQNIKSGSVFRDGRQKGWVKCFRTAGYYDVCRSGGKSPNPDGSDSDGMDVEGPDGYRYKPDGLMKQSFSITTATHQKLHLISYYARSHPSSQNLIQPTHDQALKHIRPVKGMYPESTVHEQQNVPVVTRAPMISSMPQHSPIPAFARQGATHPASYQQVPSSYGWPPSPVATPPTGVQMPQYALHALPPPSTSTTGSPMSYNTPPFSSAPITQSNGGSPRMYDRPSLPQLEGLTSQPPSHRGSIGSPLMPLQHRSPRSSQAQVQRSTPPLALPTPNVQSNPSQQYDERYSSPANSTSSNTSPGNDATKWDINPLRSSPTGMDTDAARSGLDVQDIPSEKLGFGEDMRALRVLDRAFAA
ncbi:hypothetical protein BDD12DRAFT_806943 [Trichophaea hybrida]|nr:hypothetical protein BDD12DRAFT_806943 [Trichophaea hybrida]